MPTQKVSTRFIFVIYALKNLLPATLRKFWELFWVDVIGQLSLQRTQISARDLDIRAQRVQLPQHQSITQKFLSAPWPPNFGVFFFAPPPPVDRYKTNE